MKKIRQLAGLSTWTLIRVGLVGLDYLLRNSKTIRSLAHDFVAKRNLQGWLAELTRANRILQNEED
jgi:hypothetical protein